MKDKKSKPTPEELKPEFITSDKKGFVIKITGVTQEIRELGPLGIFHLN